MPQILPALGRRLKKKLKELAPVAIGAVVVSLVLWGVVRLVEPTLPTEWRSMLDLLGSGDFAEGRDRLVNILDDAPVPPELAFVGLQVVQVVVAPIPGQLAGLAGGYIFDFGWGLALTMAGLGTGTFMAIGLARLLGERVVRHMVPARNVQRFDELVEAGGLWSFFLIFLLPVLPDDAACFLAGLTRLSIWHLVGVALAGRLPGMAVLAFVGAEAGEPGQLPYMVVGIATALSLVFWLFSEEVEEWIQRHVSR